MDTQTAFDKIIEHITDIHKVIKLMDEEKDIKINRLQVQIDNLNRELLGFIKYMDEKYARERQGVRF